VGSFFIPSAIVREGAGASILAKKSRKIKALVPATVLTPREMYFPNRL
jgi:hypothetical protein